MFVTIAIAISISMAAPATAATDDVDDPSGDVADLDGAAATQPEIDITNVAIDSDADSLEATITVSQVVPFDDDRWNNLSFLIGVNLHDPSAPADEGAYAWVLSVFDGEASAGLSRGIGNLICITDATQTATAYVLTANEACVRALPRSLEFSSTALYLDGDVFRSDNAPDTGFAGPVEAFARAEATRLAGTDRILTAVALSQDSFPDDGSAGAVVLAAALSFPDALAGGPLASYAGAPMLLTGADGLDARVADEIERVLGPGGTVYVLGGTAALSDQVVADVRAAGFDPERVAGVNRFETAIAIAGEIDATIGGHVTVLVADGRSFTDALIAGAAAPTALGVVVLTDGSTMPEATADYLGADDATERFAIGSAAAAAATGIARITGANPSELSVNVAEELSPIGGSVAVASQASFADALAGGPHIAGRAGPLLLTDPQTLSTATRDALEGADGRLREVTVYGGTAAISPAVEQAIDAALAP